MHRVPTRRGTCGTVTGVGRRRLRADDSRGICCAHLARTLERCVRRHFNFSTVRVAAARVVTRLDDANSTLVISRLQALFRVTSLIGFTGRLPLLGRGSQGLIGTIRFVGLAGARRRRHRRHVTPALDDDSGHIGRDHQVTGVLLCIVTSTIILVLTTVV